MKAHTRTRSPHARAKCDRAGFSAAESENDAEIPVTSIGREVPADAASRREGAFFRPGLRPVIAVASGLAAMVSRLHTDPHLVRGQMLLSGSDPRRLKPDHLQPPPTTTQPAELAV
jgi:hypothetical protein